jgi:anti-anti-sigma factor
MKLEYSKGILFIRFINNIDHSISYKINSLLIPKILSEKIKYIALNMYEVNDIDEFGLDALLNMKCAIRTNNGKICLCEVSDKLKRKLRNIRIKKVENELNVLNLIGAI